MSTVAEIATLIRLADGNLSVETLAKVIGRRWPKATAAEVKEAMTQASVGLPDDVDDRAAMDVAMAGILGRKRTP